MTDTTTPAATPEVAYNSTEDAAQALMARWNSKAETPTAEDDEAQAPEADERDEPTSEQADEATADDEGDDSAESEDDLEIDVGGDKLRLPAKLKEQAEHIQRKVKELEAGSTRKFQEAAELRKQVEAEREHVQFLNKLAAQHTDLLADARSTAREIEQLNQIDWNSLSDSDPVQAQKYMARLMLLQNSQQRIGQQLGEAARQMGAREQELRQQQAARGSEVLSKLIPNLTDASKKELAEYINARELTPEGKQALWDPEVVAAFHDAKKYRELRSANPAEKKAVQATQSIKPKAQASTQSGMKQKMDAVKKQVRESGRTGDIANMLLLRAMTRK